MESTGGRRAKALAVSENAGKAAGLDITKNHISMVLTELTGRILKYQRIVLPYAPGDDYYKEVCGKLEDFLKEGGCGRESILGIGISFPGIMDLESLFCICSEKPRFCSSSLLPCLYFSFYPFWLPYFLKVFI